MPDGRRVGALAVLPVAVLGVAGCGRVVKAADVETKIERYLEARMPSRAVAVDCPGGQKAERGARFVCDVEVDGRPAVADVTLVSDDRFRLVVRER